MTGMDLLDIGSIGLGWNLEPECDCFTSMFWYVSVFCL